MNMSNTSQNPGETKNDTNCQHRQHHNHPVKLTGHGGFRNRPENHSRYGKVKHQTICLL